MKSKVYTSSLAKRIVLALGLVVLPLSVVSQTQAKGPGSILGKPTIAIVSVGEHPGISINNATQLKARLLHLILRNARLNPKSVKVLSNCGCAAVAPQDLMGFKSCMKGCMADVGVTAVSIIMCGAACAAAGTGIGAIVCAICVGVSVTVIEVCAMGCAGYPHGFGLLDARGIKSRHATSGSLQAKLRLQPARGKS